MGGFRAVCPFCGKWKLAYNAIRDHIKGAHPKEWSERRVQLDKYLAHTPWSVESFEELKNA